MKLIKCEVNTCSECPYFKRILGKLYRCYLCEDFIHDWDSDPEKEIYRGCTLSDINVLDKGVLKERNKI